MSFNLRIQLQSACILLPHNLWTFCELCNLHVYVCLLLIARTGQKCDWSLLPHFFAAHQQSKLHMVHAHWQLKGCLNKLWLSGNKAKYKHIDAIKDSDYLPDKVHSKLPFCKLMCCKATSHQYQHPAARVDRAKSVILSMRMLACSALNLCGQQNACTADRTRPRLPWVGKRPVIALDTR